VQTQPVGDYRVSSLSNGFELSTYWGNTVNHLDDIDRTIILLLNEDGRMSSAEIARRMGDIPPRTVSHRVENLVGRGIISIKAILNPEALGYDVLADVYLEVEPGRVREVANIVADFPQVSYVACATGESDVSISIRVRNVTELFNFVTEQLSVISGVRRTQTHLLPVKVKDLDNWLPVEFYHYETEGDT
jgi:Lrp/AsnC family transcriptional regulator for asnA, asnC and gidA